MRPKSLILTVNDALAQAIIAAAHASGMDAIVSKHVGESLRILQRQKVDAIFLDCASVDDAIDIAIALRCGKSNRNSIVIAITNRGRPPALANDAGANFVLEIPLSVFSCG